jgi:lipopolysaccharide export system permease protein
MTETSRDGTLFSREGIWLERDGTFISIASLARGGAPSGIQLYEFGNDTVLDRYVGAARADIHPESADRAARDPRTWALRQVVEKRYGVDGGVATRHYDTLDWTPPWQQNTALYELPLESLSLTDINERRRYLAAEGRASGIFDMEYWRRLLLPASGIVFSLFAAPFVLGVGPRASMGGAVTLGVGNALVMFLVQQIGTNAIYLATHSPALAVALPILAVAALATLLIRRVNGPPR